MNSKLDFAVTAVSGTGRQRLALVVVGGVNFKARQVVDKAGRDAQAVAAAMRKAGFVVRRRADPGLAALWAALQAFRERLQPGSLGFACLAVDIEGANRLVKLLERAPVTLAALLIGATVLSGCASRPGLSPGRDGPGTQPPPNLASTPDARPRVEALRVGGPNKPYEMLGQRWVPMTSDLPLDETGGASWYGRKFHGLPTSSGETYDMYAMTAAHRTMPIPSFARVRNPANGREVIVRINDRGPFSAGRVIDLSYTAALKLGVLSGVATVQVHRLTHREIRELRARDEQQPD